MRNKIFDPENGFWRLMGILADVLMFSLIWLVCAATVVLLGPGTTALYDSMAKNLRKGELGGYVRFWNSLKSNFKTACPAGLVVFALGFGLVKLHGWLYVGASDGDSARFVGYIGFWGLFVAVCGVVSYLFPLLSRFEFNVPGLLVTGAKLAFANPKATLLLGLLTGGSIMLCVLFWLPGLFVPYLWALAATFILEPIFKPYMEEQGRM